MSRSSILVVTVLAATSLSAQSAFDLTGYVAARGVNATGPPSWLEGGFGRLEAGGDRNDYSAIANIGVDWHPAGWLDLHASGVARRDPDAFAGDDAGLVEAYVDLHKDFSFDEVRLRAGSFFLPTSKENKGDNWASPYTLHFSSLNTWIGEEVRPIGVDAQYRHTTGAGHTLTAALTGFRGNDTMGTLLGWRGWTVGDRLTTYNETLPLPPLGSLADTGPFRKQRDEGTQPFGKDLDGHTGISARLRYGIPQRGSIQYTYVDNGGDRRIYGDQYSWKTRFHLLGAEVGNPDNLILATEYLKGDTYMGVTNPFVAADFWSAYVLLSEKRGRSRWTARYEMFHTTDEDETAAEDNTESGRSWTLTWMHDLTPHLRAAIELTQITGNRPAAEQYGFDASTTGHSTTAEVRWVF